MDRLKCSSAKWIWCEEEGPNTYCSARGRFDLTVLPIKGQLCLFADSRYQVWVNGRYVGQGPTPFRKPWIYVDTFDITTSLRVGRNVVAILGTSHGVPHCTYTLGKPGMIAELEVVDIESRQTTLVTDERWKVTALTAFQREVPRRNGATAWMECFDARKEPVGWREIDFDDSGWPYARPIDSGQVNLLPRIVPYLKEYPVGPVMILNTWQTDGLPPSLEELTGRLDQESLTPVMEKAKFPVILDEDTEGWALTIDLGEEIAGQIELEVDAPAGITIDLCPAENLRGRRPWCRRKGTNYAKRYITRNGRQSWRTFGYDGMRYVHAVVRGPRPKVIFHRLGAWRRETSLPIRAAFECDDPVVNRIWRITSHTMTIGAQEVHVDCPTREQTSAWGDHIWSGFWEAYMTGDVSHLRHLLLAVEQIQASDGQVRDYAFSGSDYTLYDYSLICIMGMWKYLEVCADGDLIRRLMPVADRILNWYRKTMGPSGLIELDGQRALEANIGQLFIDHPGLKNHNHPYPLIDRRGINAALNFFFILALEAQANCLDYLGDKDQARARKQEAETLRRAAHPCFYHPRQKRYADGCFQGRRSDHVSQQTNALAVLAGVCPADMTQDLLLRMLDPNDATLCRCGTYFWTYLAEALCRAGMHGEMWRDVVRLWNDMAERGATSWWETFLGDELDSLCHIWSCVPGYLILAEILGVKPAEPGFTRITMTPQLGLLNGVKGTVPVPSGLIRIEWAGEIAKKQLRITNHSLSAIEMELPVEWVTVDNRKRYDVPPYGFRSDMVLNKTIKK